jgi:plasmid stability protein
MVALQIRDVPDDVRDVLAEQAAARGQSLQAFLLGLVEDEARRSGNGQLLRRFAGRVDGSTLTAGQAARLMDESRDRR